MKITFYPTLMSALEGLGEGECLYTSIKFLYLPLRVGYKREGGEHKVHRVEWKVKEENPSEYGNPILEKEDYWAYFFRMRDIEDFIKDLASGVRANRGVFLEPVEEAILVGLEEELVGHQSRDFLSVGVLGREGYYDYKKYRKNSIEVERVLEKAIRADEWKNKLLESARSEEELYLKIKEIYSHNFSKGKEKHKAYIGVVDKDFQWLDEDMGKRLVGRVWEKDGLVMVDATEPKKVIEDVLLTHESRFRETKSFFPDIIGKLLIEIEEKEGLELVAVLVERNDIKEEGLEEVRFLVLGKGKIENISFSWVETKGHEIYTSQKTNIESYEVPEVLVSVEDYSRNDFLHLIDEDSPKGEKRAIIRLTEKRSVSISEATNLEIAIERGEIRGPRVYKIDYTLERGRNKDLGEKVLLITFSIDNKGEVKVGEYKEIGKGGEKEESLLIEVVVPPEKIKKAGPCRLTEKSKEAIASLIEDIGNKIEESENIEKSEYEEYEEEKEPLDLANLEIGKRLARRVADILRRSSGMKENCSTSYVTHTNLATEKLFNVGKITYKVVSRDKDRERIDFERQIVEVLESMLKDRDMVSRGVLRDVYGFIRYVYYEDKNLETCFRDRQGSEKKIKVVDLEKIGSKDEAYVREIKNIIEKGFKEYLEKERNTQNREKEELKYVEDISIGIASTLVSSISNIEGGPYLYLLKDVKNLHKLELSILYNILVNSLSFLCYKYDYDKGTWKVAKENKNLLKYCDKNRIKNFIENIVALEVSILKKDISEIKVDGKLGRAWTSRNYSWENLVVLRSLDAYLRTESKGKLLKIRLRKDRNRLDDID